VIKLNVVHWQDSSALLLVFPEVFIVISWRGSKVSSSVWSRIGDGELTTKQFWPWQSSDVLFADRCWANLVKGIH